MHVASSRPHLLRHLCGEQKRRGAKAGSSYKAKYKLSQDGKGGRSTSEAGKKCIAAALKGTGRCAVRIGTPLHGNCPPLGQTLLLRLQGMGAVAPTSTPLAPLAVAP